MTKTNRDSILQSNFCDVVNYFRGRETDDADRLVQRALTVLFVTDNLAQTGYEVDADPFSANMFAGAAIGSINASIKEYPFVRAPLDGSSFTPCSSAQEREATLDQAEELIEMAEALVQKQGLNAVEVASIYKATRRLVARTHGVPQSDLAV